MRRFVRSAAYRKAGHRRGRIALGEIHAADGERDPARHHQRITIRQAGSPGRGRVAADPRLPGHAHG
ncbi:MAG TPA: hypothetical protein VHS32_40695, partial [Streptosporangiaceae bacterium]|nr:hypothetical protein [Streptosporangiaceae bacterium]